MEAESTTRRLNDLTSRYVREGVGIWERYADSVLGMSERATDLGGAPRRFGEFARSEGTDLVRRLIRLNTDYYSALLDIGVNFAQEAIDAVLGSSEPRTAEAPGREDRPVRTELVFAGHRGESPARSFVVSNTRDVAREVSFEATEFLSEDGTTRTRVPIRFSPETFTLEPGAERVVSCSVPLTADFASGQRHLARVRVVGSPGMEIQLLVEPLAEGD